MVEAPAEGPVVGEGASLWLRSLFLCGAMDGDLGVGVSSIALGCSSWAEGREERGDDLRE